MAIRALDIVVKLLHHYKVTTFIPSGYNVIKTFTVHFADLSHYVQILPVERPDFSELREKLEIELTTQPILLPSGYSQEDSPPHNRLGSHHHNHLLLHNLDHSARHPPL